MNIKKIALKYQDIFFLYVLKNGLSNCKTVLDVGCGDNSSIGRIKGTFKSEGIDIYKKSVAVSKKNKLHDRYKVGDIKNIKKFYKEKSFDACVSIDVVEHLKKAEGKKLIKDMEKIAKKKVIILTPNGFYAQHHYLGNPYQKHYSGWKKKDLEKLGYKVYGLRGLKYLRNDHAMIKYKPWIFWGFCVFLSEILFFHIPSLSFDLYAEKDLQR